MSTTSVGFSIAGSRMMRPGVEGHGQALARALRVPDHADAPVARLAARSAARPRSGPSSRPRAQRALQLGGAQRLVHRHLHRVELVVARHLLDERAAAVVLEDDEVAHQVEEAALRRRRPRSPPAARAGAGRPAPRPSIVRQGLNHSRPAVSVPTRASTPSETTSSALEAKSDGISRLVGLELLEGRPDRGVLVGRVLQLDHRQRQAVDEQHDVRPAGVLVLDDGELVDREPVVVLRRRRSRSPAPARRGSRRRACGTRPSRRPPAGDARRGCARPASAPSGRVSLRKASSSASAGSVGIEPRQRIAQPLLQHHLAVVAPLGRGLAAARSRGRARPTSRAPSSQARAASSTTDSVKLHALPDRRRLRGARRSCRCPSRARRRSACLPCGVAQLAQTAKSPRSRAAALPHAGDRGVPARTMSTSSIAVTKWKTASGSGASSPAAQSWSQVSAASEPFARAASRRSRAGQRSVSAM